jgi:hypothetical protein
MDLFDYCVTNTKHYATLWDILFIAGNGPFSDTGAGFDGTSLRSGDPALTKSVGSAPLRPHVSYIAAVPRTFMRGNFHVRAP